MIDPSIPPKLHDLIHRELKRDERLEWAGMPTRVWFTPAATGAFLFGIPWTAFALFWTAAAGIGTWNAGGDAGLFRLFPFFGLPFVLVGFGMLSSPYWAYRRACNTVYAITDRRAILFEGGRRTTTVRSFKPMQLRNVHRRQKNDGSGDVLFSRRTWRDSDGDAHSVEVGFLRVQDVRDVEQRLQELAERSPRDAQKENL
jgi:hypothetical protein